MAVQTDAALQIRAAQVADETAPGANTAIRVGELMEDFIESKVNRGDAVLTAKFSLTSAEILALGTTFKTIIPAPGAGKMIRPISLVARLNYATTAYTTNILSAIIYQGVSGNLTTTSVLGNTENIIVEQPFSTALSFTTGSNNPVNKAVQIAVPAGNPVAGDGTLDVYITYGIITL